MFEQHNITEMSFSNYILHLILCKKYNLIEPELTITEMGLFSKARCMTVTHCLLAT